jgi:hypothetical protein
MKKKKIYLAQPMGGRIWGEVKEEAQAAQRQAAWYNFDAWCPPLKEKGTPRMKIISTSRNQGVG